MGASSSRHTINSANEETNFISEWKTSSKRIYLNKKIKPVIDRSKSGFITEKNKSSKDGNRNTMTTFRGNAEADERSQLPSGQHANEKHPTSNPSTSSRPCASNERSQLQEKFLNVCI